MSKQKFGFYITLGACPDMAIVSAALEELEASVAATAPESGFDPERVSYYFEAVIVDGEPHIRIGWHADDQIAPNSEDNNAEDKKDE